MIKAFEDCFELGWNSLRDLLQAEATAGLLGSRDTWRLAFRVGLIREGEACLAMLQGRNLTSHTDNRSTAEQHLRAAEPAGGGQLPALLPGGCRSAAPALPLRAAVFPPPALGC